MDNNERQGYKMIVRNGCPNPPKDAYICPYCRENVKGINFQEYQPAPWVDIRSDSEVMGTGFEMPLVPSFECQHCGCKWQWLPLTKKDEKPEAEKKEEEKSGPKTAHEITIGSKKSWFSRFANYMTK